MWSWLATPLVTRSRNSCYPFKSCGIVTQKAGEMLQGWLLDHPKKKVARFLTLLYAWIFEPPVVACAYRFYRGFLHFYGYNVVGFA